MFPKIFALAIVGFFLCESVVAQDQRNRPLAPNRVDVRIQQHAYNSIQNRRLNLYDKLESGDSIRLEGATQVNSEMNDTWDYFFFFRVDSDYSSLDISALEIVDSRGHVLSSQACGAAFCEVFAGAVEREQRNPLSFLTALFSESLVLRIYLRSGKVIQHFYQFSIQNFQFLWQL